MAGSSFSVDPNIMADMPHYSDLYGEFLSSKTSRFAEVLRDYNQYLELVFIPKNKRDASDTKPFAIKDNTPGRASHIVRHLTEAEVERPEEILAWLFEGDLSKHTASELIDRARLKRMASELMDAKREADVAAERQDLIAALSTGGKDRKTTGYRHNGRIFTDRGSRAAQTHH